MTLRSDWVPQTAPPVDINKGGSSGGGSIGTDTTPNVSTIKDGSSTNKAAVDSNGRFNTTISDPTTPANRLAIDSQGRITAVTAPSIATNTAANATSANATTTDSVILAANAARKRVLINNLSTTSKVIVRYTSAATATLFNWVIPPSSNGASYLAIPLEYILPDAIHAITDTGTAALVITEFVG